MSLADLTRNAFQSGLSSTKWLALAKLFISKESAGHAPEDIQRALSNSVLVLYKSYPGDPSLRDYLKHAIQDGILSISVFVATLLQAARSSELHSSDTLDMLCRVALNAHYSSGRSPIGSIVPYSESSIVVLGTVQDALALLRTAYSLSLSTFHPLIASASELVIILLSCVTDMSQISTAQAVVHFTDVSDMLHNLRLSPDVRQVLETFVMSLSIIIGDDAKAAREAQMMQTLQLAFGKGDLIGHGSDTDTTSITMLLNSLVANRGHEFSSGSGLHPVAMLVAVLRWTSWAPQVFYTQLIVSAFTCLAQYSLPSKSRPVLIWKSFVFARIPRLLVMFEKVVQTEATTQADWREAMQAALKNVIQHSNMLQRCDQVLYHDGNTETMAGLDFPPSSLKRFVHTLLCVGLVSETSIATVEPGLLASGASKLHSEAQEHGLDLEAYIDSKIFNEATIDEAVSFLERLWADPECHATFAGLVMKRFSTSSSTFDVETLSKLCRLLYTDQVALDILTLHISLSEILAQALALVEDYDCDTVGDPQTAVTHLGYVVLFLQHVVARFKLPRTFQLGSRTLSADILLSSGAASSADKQGKYIIAFNAWFKAIFDSNDGIEDSILRLTRPKTLLRISATLFFSAIKSCEEKNIDFEKLQNGVQYFLEPILNWTLVNVIKALLDEIHRKGSSASLHLVVLETLLLSDSCPKSVLVLCSTNVLRLLQSLKTQDFPGKHKVGSIRDKILQALPTKPGGTMTQGALSLDSAPPWMDQSRQAIRQAFAQARAGKATFVDVDRCLAFTVPSKFLHMIWSEGIVAASMGEMEHSRRIATFILTMPRALNAVPLLPIFLHVTVPMILADIDGQQPSEQTISIELLVSIVSSSLSMAFYLEWSLSSVCNDQRNILGQASAPMARRLASDLRALRKSSSSALVIQRLSTLPAFVSNFPVFMADT